MGRRAGLLVVMMAVVLVLSSGVALAGYFVGTRGDDRLVGRNQDDEMYGLRGEDDIRGKDGDDYIEGGTGDDDLFGQADNDEMYGGRGADDLFGGDGDDFLNAADNRPNDRVCTGGQAGDVFFVDLGDAVDPASCP